MGKELTLEEVRRYEVAFFNHAIAAEQAGQFGLAEANLQTSHAYGRLAENLQFEEQQAQRIAANRTLDH